MAASDLLAGAVKSSEDSADMTSEPTQHYDAGVVIIGFGAAGGCAAIEAHDGGANAVLLEKQPEATHYSNTHTSGGGFHS